MNKLTSAQRRKCMNILVDEEVDSFSYEKFDTILTHILVYGTRQTPYNDMSDQDLLDTLYDHVMDKYDLKTFDDEALISWLDEQKNVPDYLGKL